VISRSFVDGFVFHSPTYCQTVDDAKVQANDPATPKPLPRAIW